jgi:hypothetical protein
MYITYKQVVSPALSSSVLQTNKEGISVIDVNGDGLKDIVITNSGDPRESIQPNDPPITILLSNKNFEFYPADTSALPATGWVNDYVFLDSNKNGLLEIVAIDHGREIAYNPVYWSQLYVFEFDPGTNKFKNLTDVPVGNSIGFYHHSANTADVNGDGLNDFIVAKMGPDNFSIFTGDSSVIFREATRSLLGSRFSDVTTWNSQSYVGPGAAGALDIRGDGDYDLIILPYTNSSTRNQSFAQVFEFERGAFREDRLINVRSNGLLVVPDAWGYSFLRVDDINGDQLPDIVGFAENPSNNAGGTAVFVSMIQGPDGSFTASPAFPAEPLITERRGELFVGNIWHDYKFSLEDLDGDGDLDLFWGQWFGGKSEYLKDGIFINDGSGHFLRGTALGDSIASQIRWSGNSGARTYMADFNLDGIGDFLVIDNHWSGSGSSTPKVFLSQSIKENVYKVGGLSTQYEVRKLATEVRLTDDLLTDGILKFPPNSRINFQDKSLAFDTEGPTSAGGIYRLYRATFNREPDTVGLGYWIAQADAGNKNAVRMAEDFTWSREFQALYKITTTDNFGTGTDVKALVSGFYQNVLGRTPDQGGLNFYTGVIQSKERTVGRVLAEISDSQENYNGTIDLIATGIAYTPFVG